MSERAVSIRVNVDPTNPGQFFACCGLLELADRLCQGGGGVVCAWATVTPVLPGCDDGRLRKAEKLFLKSLRHAGYAAEALADLEFRPVSFWLDGDRALSFQRPDYLKKDNWSVYHVRLRWSCPVKGPLAVGAGRHCGLGVFAALPGDP